MGRHVALRSCDVLWVLPIWPKPLNLLQVHLKKYRCCIFPYGNLVFGSVWSAGRYWKWRVWYHPQSQKKSGWNSAYWCHWVAIQVLTKLPRLSRGRSSDLRRCKSEIESKLLPKCESYIGWLQVYHWLNIGTFSKNFTMIISLNIMIATSTKNRVFYISSWNTAAAAIYPWLFNKLKNTTGQYQKILFGTTLCNYYSLCNTVIIRMDTGETAVGRVIPCLKMKGENEGTKYCIETWSLTMASSIPEPGWKTSDLYDSLLGWKQLGQTRRLWIVEISASN